MKLTYYLLPFVAGATALPEALPEAQHGGKTAKWAPDGNSWDYYHAIKCGKKYHGRVNGAINMFCNSYASVNVPSILAKKGGWYQGVHVSVKGTCHPAQALPQRWCNSQFHYICAEGNKKGAGAAQFGHNGCQHFQITIDS